MTSALEFPTEPPGGLDARFCEVMDAAPVRIWVSSHDKLCVWFNRPWLTFTGRSMAQELGNGWADGVYQEDFERCLGIYNRHFDARKEFRMQYRLRRHDGAYRWIDDTGIPRFARDGTFLGYIGSCTEIHELRETQAELRRRILEIGHLNRRADAAVLAACIAHELNQPLGAILSNAETAEIYLKANPPNLGLIEETLVDIRRDNCRAAEVITRMRRLLTNREFEPQELDLKDVVRVVHEIVLPQATDLGVVLCVHQQQIAFPVLAEPIHLQQVVLNLALNGIDAMRDTMRGQRRMKFQTTRVGKSTAEVSVSDSGTGIQNDKLDGVFEPFFTTKRHGTGLGLSIARGVIETYGGRIWAENRPKGGAVFRFTLPLAKAHVA